jgi:nucleoid DNA-binding protein
VSRSVNLTTSILRKKVAQRTGLPEKVVGAVLRAALQEMQEEIVQQGTVKLAGFVNISTTVRRLGGNMSDTEGSRILLTVRPMRSFRKRLNLVFSG